MIKEKNIIEMLAQKEAENYAINIDEHISLWFVKPKWCPRFLYKFIGKNFIIIKNQQ